MLNTCYCRTHHYIDWYMFIIHLISIMLILHIALLLLSFYIIAVVCDYYFVPSLEKISERLKLSSEFAWATLMAVGSSAPELFTSLFAVLNPWLEANLWAWTIVWSALFNILVIIWATALVRKATIMWQPIVRDMVFYMLAIGALYWMFRDQTISLFETWVFLLLYAVYVYCAAHRRKRLGYEEPDFDETINDPEQNWWITDMFTKLLNHIIPNPEGKNYIRAFVLSIIAIGLSTHLMVDAWVHVAQTLGIPSVIIGLTILAMGTSVPDLLSSLVVAKRGKWDMAISNAVWSNIFDILFGLGFPYLLYYMIYGNKQQLIVEDSNLEASIVLLFASVVVILVLLLMNKRKVTRPFGLFLILLYVAYVGYNVYMVM